MAILNRWQQFGRRYFWPHLILGVIATSFGLPVVAVGAAHVELPASISAFSLGSSQVSQKWEHRREASRRLSYQFDYWQQHAVRGIIYHLSCVLSRPLMPESSQSIQIQKRAWLDFLSILVVQNMPANLTSSLLFVSNPNKTSHNIGQWLAEVFGIRAGPLIFA